MSVYINKDSIVAVKVYEKTEKRYLQYRPAHKFLWLWKCPEGLYQKDLLDGYWTFKGHQDEFVNYYVEDDKVYLNPFIEIIYSKGYERKYFKTMDELNSFLNKIKFGTNLIQIR